MHLARLRRRSRPVVGDDARKPLRDAASSSAVAAVLVDGLGGAMGVSVIPETEPAQTLAFLALSVIPALKIADGGLTGAERFERTGRAPRRIAVRSSSLSACSRRPPEARSSEVISPASGSR